MGAAEGLSRLPDRLPDSVTVSESAGVSFTPNQMRRLKAETGRTMEELMGEVAAEEDRLQTMAWLALVREGYSPSWDQAGDVALRFEADTPDPTKSGS